jgi:hypothetical protein
MNQPFLPNPSKPEEIWALIGCEESQAITLELLAMGVNVYSCDYKPCSGGRPDRHIQGDVLEAIASRQWHYAVFHPTCTRLTNAGVLRLYYEGKKINGIDPVKWAEMVAAAEFFNKCLNANIPHIRVENPIPHGYAMKIIGQKYAQIIQPYNFNEDASKATCLWTKNLPIIQPTSYFPPRYIDGKPRWDNQTDGGQNKLPPDKKGQEGRRAELRSKTYPGIAQAIAKQDIYHILNPQQIKLF